MIERSVAMAERFIAPPGASVEHNQWLPELATGTMRQCDVVIRTGSVPRQTLTIVEVQDRGRKVGISDYDGWCEKRKQLGAQHLICVSSEGFPESVRRRAALEGDTVRLVTLLGPNATLPFQFPLTMLWELTVMQTMDVAAVFEQQVPADFGKHLVNEPVFLFGDKTEPVSLEQVVEYARSTGKLQDMARSEGSVLGEFTLTYTVRLTDLLPLRYHSDQRPLGAVELQVKEAWKHHHYDVPIEAYAYEQIGFDETLAWVVMASAEHEGQPLSSRIPVRMNKCGRIQIGPGEMSALKGHTMLHPARIVLAVSND